MKKAARYGGEMVTIKIPRNLLIPGNTLLSKMSPTTIHILTKYHVYISSVHFLPCFMIVISETIASFNRKARAYGSLSGVPWLSLLKRGYG